MIFFVFLPSITFGVHGLPISIYSYARLFWSCGTANHTDVFFYYYYNQNPCLLLESCLVVRNYDSLLRCVRLCKTHLSRLELVLFKHYELPSWLVYQTQGNIIINTVNKIRLELYLGVLINCRTWITLI